MDLGEIVIVILVVGVFLLYGMLEFWFVFCNFFFFKGWK